MPARFLRFLLAAVAVGSAAATILAQGGRFSLGLDVFTHFAPIYLVGALTAGAVEWAALRRPAILAAAAAAVLGAAALMAPEFLRSLPLVPAAAAGPRTLTLVQFNARRVNTRHAEIVDWIVAQRPDVVMVEEIDPDLRDRLLRRTGWNVVGRRTTVMIFSPYPLTGVGVRPIEASRGAPTWVNALMAGPWGETPLLALHAEWPTRDLDDRAGPIMAGVVQAIRSDTLLVAGDFNSTPWSFKRRRDDRAFGLQRLTKAVFSWPTAMGPFAAFPIDHVYAGAAWRLVSVTKGPGLGSDHFPLALRVALTKGPVSAAGQGAP